MSIIVDFIKFNLKNQEKEYTFFVDTIKEIQPFAFLSTLSFSLSIFADNDEISINATIAGILFLLAFFSLLSFKFIKPSFGLFLYFSYLCTFLGFGLLFIFGMELLLYKDLGESIRWLSAIFISFIILFISYFGYANSIVDKWFKINFWVLFSSYGLLLLYGIIQFYLEYFIKININDFQITGYIFLTLMMIFIITLLSFVLIILRRPKQKVKNEPYYNIDDWEY